eukprot:TRINITY_DN27059_c0_g1_i1.p1 TRINITY_DN27059_c0_g1~~TRINITY_DN27059_c0_g1_i1.p1  ORF type:complete len:1218 (-),score=337.57 TRINITY_DN27059_c0_g1_i1:5-3658(-)
MPKVVPVAPLAPKGTTPRSGRLLPAIGDRSEAATTPRSHWEPTPPALPAPRPALQRTEDVAAVLPPKIGAALDDHLSMLALEEWLASANGAFPAKASSFESRLLYCEARLQHLDRLAAKLPRPSPVLTAAVMRLMYEAFETLPAALSGPCMELASYIERSVYSEERLGEAEMSQMRKVVDNPVDRVPHFSVAMRQQVQLERTERKAHAMQRVVEGHFARREKVLNFIIRLQGEERYVLRSWLFKFWAFSFKKRRQRMEAMANLVLSTPQDVVTPFVSWRLFVSERHVERARVECHKDDMEASDVANQIAEIEIENERQLERLEEALAQSTIMKEKCSQEMKEYERLQNLWSVTQPELLLSVAVKSLDLLFGFIIREARFEGLALRRRLGGISATGLAPPELLAASKNPSSPQPDIEAEQVIIIWLNSLVDRAKIAAWHLCDTQLLPEEQLRLQNVMEADEVDDLSCLDDSIAFCAAFAVIKAERDGLDFNVDDLAPLDERDLDTRAQRVCAQLASLVPVISGKSLLSPEDLVYGTNTRLTSRFLACLFLVEPLLPEAVEPQDQDDGSDAVSDLEDDLDAENLDEMELKDRRRRSSNLARTKARAARCTMRHVYVKRRRSNVSDGDSDEEGEEPREEAEEVNRFTSIVEDQSISPLLEDILRAVEEHAGGLAWEQLQDHSPLLHYGGEETHELATTSAEQLLLRWINVQLHDLYHMPVENFGSDLQDGKALWMLLQAVVPELVPAESEPEKVEERAEMIATIVLRCTDFELLTATAIVEGQSDVLAAFLAQLFLARPNLKPRSDSLLAMHLKLLETTVTSGLATLSQAREATMLGNSAVMSYCSRLNDQWNEISLALQFVQEVREKTEAVQNLMHVFLSDTLACRARGKPRTMLDAKEAREFLLYTSLSPEHAQILALKDGMDNSVISKVEEVLRKSFRLVRDFFRYYQTATAQGTQGVTLENLMRLYQDCKLRSRELAPHHIEVIFNDFFEKIGSESVLFPQGFVAVLVQCAKLKFGMSYVTMGEQVAQLIEHHLKPNQLHDSATIFQRIIYDPAVREVLNNHSHELHIVYELYAMADFSDIVALQNASTMNIKEFMMLLTHCKMLDETLTETAVHDIFEGIQQSAVDGEQEEGGLDDADELAFSEFLDGIVAITAYKAPDPFTPFNERVEAFVLSLFDALRHYWSRRRISPEVDSMLNALQKKLLTQAQTQAQSNT